MPNLDAVKTLLKECLQFVSLEELSRVWGHTYRCYSSLEVQQDLLQIQDRESLLDAICDTVGLEDVGPLMSLLGFLSVESTNEQVSKCLKVLSRHQDSAGEQLGKCIQCTSPPSSPSAYPYFVTRPSIFSLR